MEKVEINHCFTEDEWLQIEELAYLNSMRVTHDEFIQKLKNNNMHFDEIEILNKYTRASDKIKCKCKKCGKEWSTAASDLLKGTGCPVCQIKAVGERRSKKAMIQEWRKNNPLGNKLQCEKQTGISRMTIYKWWDA